MFIIKVERPDLIKIHIRVIEKKIKHQEIGNSKLYLSNHTIKKTLNFMICIKIDSIFKTN